MFLKLFYPISTLPEHLHSTFPSHAKLPENTLTEKKNIPFPSLTLITCLTSPPVTPPPFTGRPSHTLSYTTILFLALKVNSRFLESLPVVTFASLELKLPVFSFHSLLLAVDYSDIVFYIYDDSDIFISIYL